MEMLHDQHPIVCNYWITNSILNMSYVSNCFFKLDLIVNFPLLNSVLNVDYLDYFWIWIISPFMDFDDPIGLCDMVFWGWIIWSPCDSHQWFPNFQQEQTKKRDLKEIFH